MNSPFTFLPFTYIQKSVRILLGNSFSLLLLCQGAALAQNTNILLITADDMNWDSVGVYNSTLARTTPNIDKLASEILYYYIRATQKNKELAWSSPIWLEKT